MRLRWASHGIRNTKNEGDANTALLRIVNFRQNLETGTGKFLTVAAIACLKERWRCPQNMAKLAALKVCPLTCSS